jgi:hypothetical protein
VNIERDIIDGADLARAATAEWRFTEAKNLREIPHFN